MGITGTPETLVHDVRSECNLGRSPYLVAYFNFFFYLLLVPFKTEYDSEKNLYYLKKIKIQRALCFTAHSLTIASISWFIYKSALQIKDIPSNGSTIIVVMLDLISNAAALAMILLLYFTFWRSEDGFLEVIEVTRSKHFERANKRKRVGIAVSLVLLTLLALFLTAAAFVLWDTHHFAADGDALQKNNSASDHGEILVIYVARSLYVYSNSCYVLTEFAIGIITFALWTLGKESLKEMRIDLVALELEKTTTDLEISETISHFMRLRKASESIRRVYGSQIFGFYVSSVSYFAETPYIFLGGRGEAEKFLAAFYLSPSVIWVLAAEFHFQVKENMMKIVQTYSHQDNISTSSRLKLIAIYNEIIADPVALSSNYFNVTYSRVSSMLSVVITYAIIVFQLRQGNSGSDTMND